LQKAENKLFPIKSYFSLNCETTIVRTPANTKHASRAVRVLVWF